MALKAVVAKIEEVPEADRGHYEQGEGGAFYLKVEGLEDGSAHPAVGALVRAKKREADRAGKAEQAAKDAAAALAAKNEEYEAALKGVVPKGNLEALEASWKEKLARQATEKDTEITSLNGSLNEVLVENVAQSLAGKLAKSSIEAPVLVPFIKSRLAVERTGGKASTRVLDADGKPSASSLEDLAKEIAGNPMFASVLLGSRASGGGAQGGGQGGGAARPDPKVDLSKADPADAALQLRAIRASRAQ